MKPRRNGLGAELRLIAKRARQVWRLVPRRHKIALGAAAFVMALTSLCNTSVPLLLGKLLDEVKDGTAQGFTPGVLYRLAGWYLGLIGLAYLLREGLNVVRRYLVDNACTRINRDMSVRLMAHVMKMDLTTFSQTKVGALHGRIYRSIEGLVRFLRLLFLDFIPALLTGLFALTAAVSKLPLLGLIMVGVIPTAVFLTFRQLISQKGVRIKLLRNCEAIDGAIVEQLGGLEYVRASNTHRLEMKRLARATERRRAREIGHHFTMSLFGGAKALNEGFFHILVLAGAVYCAIIGVISLGDVLTFSILFLNVMTPLSEVHRVLDEGHENSLRVGDLLKLLAEPVDRSFANAKEKGARAGRSKTPVVMATEPGQPTRATPENGRAGDWQIQTTWVVPHNHEALASPSPSLPASLSAGASVIVVENLQVEYTNAEGKRIRALDGISLAIRQGETIGVAGRSGSGKSTWLKVMLRLVHPCGGAVWVGGVPLQALERADVARLMGYVGQSPFVFSGTIAQNIAYGNGPVALEDIRRAARLAHLHDEIVRMPGEYDAVVQERGQNLSGGQRQRLALARILLKQPPILILDEATSALDNISERHVQRALGLAHTERTTILVAHRLSTLRDADRILVFDNGRIVETGTYDELLRRGGVFTELVHSAENGVKGNGSPGVQKPRPEPWISPAPQLVTPFAPMNPVAPP
jgi:ATP-binding cassette subfamily B protein